MIRVWRDSRADFSVLALNWRISIPHVHRTMVTKNVSTRGRTVTERTVRAQRVRGGIGLHVAILGLHLEVAL